VKDLVIAILAWIAVQLGVQPPVAPQIEFASPQQMAQLAYGSCQPTLPVTALYDRKTHTVYLDKGWQPDDLRNQSILLHELVHHVQESHQFPYPCMAAREGAAYSLQVKWLREHGVADPFSLLNINEITILLASACRDE
jgi:hypothetical protein